MLSRGGVAGAAAAAVWRASDPLLKRMFGTPYADAELLGPLVTRGPLEPVASLASHCAAGAVFGHVFERLGGSHLEGKCIIQIRAPVVSNFGGCAPRGRGVRRGVAVALAENVLLWPGLAVFDRIHPKRRDGTWPPLASSPRVFAQAAAGHALFGALLGGALRR